MPRRKKRTYSAEQKQAAVDLYRELGSMRAVSEQLGIPDSSIHRWVRAARIAGTLEPAEEEEWPKPSESELEELKRLRKENEQLRVEKEILKKAAAFFARESDGSTS